MPVMAWLLFIGAAVLEVGGNASIHRGLRGRELAPVVVGGLILAAYGVVVNLLAWDFSRLFGVYVAAFAVISVLCGRFVFGEPVPPSTWLGLLIIVAGSAVIQFG
jgi:small multidrug resistance family-3 protein